MALQGKKEGKKKENWLYGQGQSLFFLCLDKLWSVYGDSDGKISGWIYYITLLLLYRITYVTVFSLSLFL